MGTFNHAIRPLRGASLPRRWVVLSPAPVVVRQGHGSPLFLETLRLGAVTTIRRDGECSFSFHDHVYESGAQLLSVLHRFGSRREATWIFAYNLGYSLAVSEFWQHCLGGSVKIHNYHLEGSTQTVAFSVNGKRFNAVDARNYLQQTMGWLYAAAKLPPAPEYEVSDTDSIALDKARLRTAALAELVVKLCLFLNKEAANSWGWSAGGIGWQSWRRGLLGNRVHVHAHAEATALERAAYCGGRQECRYLGTVNSTVSEVDFNSLYAHCSVASLPVRLAEVETCSLAALETGLLREHRLACARVVVNSRLKDYPYLYWQRGSAPPGDAPSLPQYLSPRPQWLRAWGRGRFSTTLATPELRRAIEAGEVERVERVAWYEPGDPFGKFVKHFWEARKRYRESGKLIEEALCKRILTVLPGKFAQRNRQWVDCPDLRPALPYGHWHDWAGEEGGFTLYRALGSAVQRFVPHGGIDPELGSAPLDSEQRERLLAAEWAHSFPAISAHVTSAARLEVDNAVGVAGPLDCFYFDTDCLHVTTVGLERLREAGLLSQTEMGRLKIVRTDYGAYYRHGKDYRIGPPQGRTSPSADNCDPRDPELPAVCGAGPVSQLFGGGADAWRSAVSFGTYARSRYAGRVGADGWVRPLWIPQDFPGRPGRGLYDEVLCQS